jgi:hypothetical protein
MGKTLKPDPLFVNASREAWVILGIWFLAGIFTVTFCYFYGYLTHEPDINSTGNDLVETFGPFQHYDRSPDSLSTPLNLGIPDWIFYGVVIPWLGCIIFTFWFCLKFFSEDDLADGEVKTFRKDS